MDAIQKRRARKWRDGQWSDFEEILVAEEPLEIRVNGRAFSATMRTPQGPDHDELLALGLTFSEGVFPAYDDVTRVSTSTRCRELNRELVNVADVILSDETAFESQTSARNLISNASCGWCGKSSVEAFSNRFAPLQKVVTNFDLLAELPAKMREKQAIFDRTGGLHGAALFDESGELLACFEDIGRHNATDKIVGWGLKNGILPAQNALILLVSGRVSMEIVQKCLAARIPTLAAVSAASNLAAELATANNLNLIGFLRARGMTVY